MTLTEQERQTIRSKFNHLQVRFCNRGIVKARPGPDRIWGILYNRRDLETLVATLRETANG